MQTNANVLTQLRQQGKTMNQKSLSEMKSYLNALNLQPSDLDQLNVIHVAGTKGKGSTCALVDSLLRHQEGNLKTGLFTSPHLQQVRERIRLNGKPLEQDLFSKYFFEIYSILSKLPNPPSYFRFLTLLSFWVFIKEKVQVAIMEVGIGGEYDSTNIIPNPKICGISSLGFDHQAILGNTLPEIAWHKAGIMKKGVPCLTSWQPDDAMSVLVKRAEERGALLQMVPELSHWQNHQQVKIGLRGEHQKSNASLALGLVRLWQKQMSNADYFKSFTTGKQTLLTQNDLILSKNDLLGLEKAKWPGRAQIVSLNQNLKFYLDGAHTPESMLVCRDWFKQEFEQEKPLENILVFNCTMGRSPESLLFPLLELHQKQPFTKIYFVTNEPYKVPPEEHSDLQNKMVHHDFDELKQQKLFQSVWQQKDSAKKKPEILIRPFLDQVLNELSQQNQKTACLITGSLHLVGSFLTVLNHPIE